ncbi:MAG: hypothetical protein ACOX6N_02580 [Patescibacteria group bacterium]|jgi:hydroxymethylpyrimidine pyrophosphatase-like HAD family hydrolase
MALGNGKLTIKNKNIHPLLPGSILESQLRYQDTMSIPRVALILDIDNTFRMQDGSLEPISRYLAASLYSSHIPLIFSTGLPFLLDRSVYNPVFLSVWERIQSGDLPYASAVYSDVGTSRFILHQDMSGKKKYKPDNLYKNHLVSLGFNRHAIVKHLQILSSQSFFQKYQFHFQDPSGESKFLLGQNSPSEPFKVSAYFFARNPKDSLILRDKIRSLFPNLLVSTGLEINYQSLHPHATPQKYWLDILPLDKHQALYDLRRLLNLSIVIAAGDSPNDETLLIQDEDLRGQPDLLSSALDLSIIVGGAQNFLLQAAKDHLSPIPSLSRITPEFYSIRLPDGRQKFYYLESGNRLGPHSIEYALRIFFEHIINCNHPCSSGSLVSRQITSIKKFYKTAKIYLDYSHFISQSSSVPKQAAAKRLMGQITNPEEIQSSLKKSLKFLYS